jgi:hypothetical protein
VSIIVTEPVLLFSLPRPKTSQSTRDLALKNMRTLAILVIANGTFLLDTFIF